MIVNNDLLVGILERTDKKLDSLIEKSADQNSTLILQSERLAEYNEHLKEHMRRTQLLEARIEPLEDDLKSRVIKKGFLADHWKKIALVFSILGGLAGTIWSVMQIIGLS